jgi:hypothetical protein
MAGPAQQWAGRGSIVGGLTETIANAAVKDVTFMIVTDIEITEKPDQGDRAAR